MILELENTLEPPLDDEGFSAEFDDENDDIEDQKDEYEYEDISPEVFKNPELLVKWIRKNPQ